jgi:HK97 family phage major capsid protein
MANTTATAAALLKPAEVEALLVQPAFDLSVAAQVLAIVRTGSTTHRLPVVTQDPTAAWTLEGAEIVPSDMTVAEVVVEPRKLAALSIVSRELADDSSPAAATAIGQGMARDLARQLDAALFGTVAAPAPRGLSSLAGVSTVDAGADFQNLDAFAEAIAAAENVGARLNSFVAHPTDALALSKLKTGTGSNVALLGQDPASPTGRVVAGVPVYVSPAVTPGTVWGIPRDRAVLVVRNDARIDVDSSAYFSSDRVGVRGTLRASFGYAHAGAIVKISTTA